MAWCRFRWVRVAKADLGGDDQVLATDTDYWHDTVWITDSTPVPCGMSRPTVRRSQLTGWAGYGCCASHSRLYWGLRLYRSSPLDAVSVGRSTEPSSLSDLSASNPRRRMQREVMEFAPEGVCPVNENRTVPR